jgi:hypothetical protein
MGFSLLSDIQPGAFTAAFLECLYPRGVDKHADPRSGDIGLREICPVIERAIPHLSRKPRRDRVTPSMSTTDKLYHLTCPIHLTGGQEQQCLTRDIQELFTHSRLLAQFPTITGQLFMNGIHMRQMQLFARTERDLNPIFHKRKLIYGFAEAEEGINITDLMATMAPQMDKLTTVKSILAKTESNHWGLKVQKCNFYGRGDSSRLLFCQIVKI